MIVTVGVIILMVLIETLIWPIAGYLVVCWWVYVARGMEEAVWAVGIGGLLLDILTPRHLGLSSSLLLGIMLIAEVSFGKGGDKKDKLVGVGICLIIIEGIWVGRSWWMILMGIIAVIIVFLGDRMRQSGRRGIIVRREI